MHPTFLTLVVRRRHCTRERTSERASGTRASRMRAPVCAYMRACLSFFRNRRRVGGAKLGDAEEGRRPVINGTRETAFLESLLVLLFAAQRRSRASTYEKVILAFEVRTRWDQRCNSESRADYWIQYKSTGWRTPAIGNPWETGVEGDSFRVLTKEQRTGGLISTRSREVLTLSIGELTVADQLKSSAFTCENKYHE